MMEDEDWQTRKIATLVKLRISLCECGAFTLIGETYETRRREKGKYRDVYKLVMMYREVQGIGETYETRRRGHGTGS